MITKLYMLWGIIMVLLGTLIATLFYFFIINSVLLTAFGLSAIILGYTSIALAYTSLHISTETKGIVLRNDNTLLIFLVAEFVIINCLLAFFKQYELSIYIIISIIVYFITLWFYIALNPRLRNALTAAGVAVFSEFLTIITFRIIQILK